MKFLCMPRKQLVFDDASSWSSIDSDSYTDSEESYSSSSYQSSTFSVRSMRLGRDIDDGRPRSKALDITVSTCEGSVSSAKLSRGDSCDIADLDEGRKKENELADVEVLFGQGFSAIQFEEKEDAGAVIQLVTDINDSGTAQKDDMKYATSRQLHETVMLSNKGNSACNEVEVQSIGFSADQDDESNARKNSLPYVLNTPSDTELSSISNETDLNRGGAKDFGEKANLDDEGVVSENTLQNNEGAMSEREFKEKRSLWSKSQPSLQSRCMKDQKTQMIESYSDFTVSTVDSRVQPDISGLFRTGKSFETQPLRRKHSRSVSSTSLLEI